MVASSDGTIDPKKTYLVSFYYATGPSNLGVQNDQGYMTAVGGAVSPNGLSSEIIILLYFMEVENLISRSQVQTILLRISLLSKLMRDTLMLVDLASSIMNLLQDFRHCIQIT